MGGMPLGDPASRHTSGPARLARGRARPFPVAPFPGSSFAHSRSSMHFGQILPARPSHHPFDTRALLTAFRGVTSDGPKPNGRASTASS